MRFGQIGEKGVFEALDRSGLLNHRVPCIRGCGETLSSPPSSSRARVRGDFVRRNAQKSQDYLCDWAYVWDRKNGRVLDLSDPFETEERWKEQPPGDAELFLSPRRGLEELYRRLSSR